jgi:hypothetical protein
VLLAEGVGVDVRAASASLTIDVEVACREIDSATAGTVARGVSVAVGLGETLAVVRIHSVGSPESTAVVAGEPQPTTVPKVRIKQ